MEKKIRDAQLKTERRGEREERVATAKAAKAARLERGSAAGKYSNSYSNSNQIRNAPRSQSQSLTTGVEYMGVQGTNTNTSANGVSAAQPSQPSQAGHHPRNVPLNAAQVQYLRDNGLLGQALHGGSVVSAGVGLQGQGHAGVQGGQSVALQQQNAQLQLYHQQMTQQYMQRSNALTQAGHPQSQAQQLAQYQMLAQRQLLQAADRPQGSQQQLPRANPQLGQHLNQHQHQHQNHSPQVQLQLQHAHIQQQQLLLAHRQLQAASGGGGVSTNVQRPCTVAVAVTAPRTIDTSTIRLCERAAADAGTVDPPTGISIATLHQ